MNDEEGLAWNRSIPRFNGESSKPSKSAARKKDAKPKHESRKKTRRAETPSSSSSSSSEPEESSEDDSSDDDSSDDCSKAKTSTADSGGFGGLGGLFDGQHDADSVGHEGVSSGESELSIAPGGFDGPYEPQRQHYYGYAGYNAQHIDPSSTRRPRAPTYVYGASGYAHMGASQPTHRHTLPTGPVPYMNYGGIPMYNARSLPPPPPRYGYPDVDRYSPTAHLIPGIVSHAPAPFPFYFPYPVNGPRAFCDPVDFDHHNIVDTSSSSGWDSSGEKKQKKYRSSTKYRLNRKGRKKPEEEAMQKFKQKKKKKKSRGVKKPYYSEIETNSKNGQSIVDAPGAWPEDNDWANNDDNKSKCADWARSVGKAGSQRTESNKWDDNASQVKISGNQENYNNSSDQENTNVEENNKNLDDYNDQRDGNDWNNQGNDNDWEKNAADSSLGNDSSPQSVDWQNQPDSELDKKDIWDSEEKKNFYLSADGSNDTPSSRSSPHDSGMNQSGRTKEYWSRAVEKEAYRQSEFPCVLPPMPLYSIPEDKIKDGAVYQVRAGPGQEVTRKLVSVNRWDSWEKPYAVFTFKYRSRGKSLLDIIRLATDA